MSPTKKTKETAEVAAPVEAVVAPAPVYDPAIEVDALVQRGLNLDPPTGFGEAF